ncbi:MAG: hypothetical protein PWR24_848 [Desulfonauticus sp.]|nr:hypothetical protein [Desulfonauticus sp.]
MKIIFVYIFYFIFSVLCMSYLPVVEMFTPILFFNLKKGKYATFWFLGFISLVLLEGVSSFNFSIFLPFVFVQYLLFHLISKFIDFETLVFDAIYFFLVSLSLFFLIKEARVFLNVYVRSFNCLLYFVFSFLTYYIFSFIVEKYELT